MKKTKFTWREWGYTNADENLYLLDKEQLQWFKLLIKEAP